jgi:hypothetical protein
MALVGSGPGSSFCEALGRKISRARHTELVGHLVVRGDRSSTLVRLVGEGQVASMFENNTGSYFTDTTPTPEPRVAVVRVNHLTGHDQDVTTIELKPTSAARSLEQINRRGPALNLKLPK